MDQWSIEMTVPTLPVVDLITDQPGSSEEDVTKRDVYGCQATWDFLHLLRLSVSRRSDLCSLLVKMVNKKAPDMKSSDAFALWSRVAKDPAWPDELMRPKYENEE